MDVKNIFKRIAFLRFLKKFPIFAKYVQNRPMSEFFWKVRSFSLFFGNQLLETGLNRKNIPHLLEIQGREHSRVFRYLACCLKEDSKEKRLQLKRLIFQYPQIITSEDLLQRCEHYLRLFEVAFPNKIFERKNPRFLFIDPDRVVPRLLLLEALQKKPAISYLSLTDSKFCEKFLLCPNRFIEFKRIWKLS